MNLIMDIFILYPSFLCIVDYFVPSGFQINVMPLYAKTSFTKPLRPGRLREVCIGIEELLNNILGYSALRYHQ